MSKLIVEVSLAEDIKKHENATSLEIAVIRGWNTVVQKGQFKIGDKCVFIPYDTLISAEIADSLGIRQYLGGKIKNRVRKIKLRGEPSFGVVIKCDQSWKIGKDVASLYGCTKYEPPVSENHTNQSKKSQPKKRHPLMSLYIDIQNIRNHPNIIKDDEEVVILEKAHGTNFGLGSIDGQILCVSRNHQRKSPGLEERYFRQKIPFLKKMYLWVKSFFPQEINLEEASKNWWWHSWSNEFIRNCIVDLGKKHKQVILYGETFGAVQYLKYNKENELDFRIFDILIDSKFVNYDKFVEICDFYHIPRMPEIYKGKYDFNKIKELSSGKTFINGASHYREGVVVKTTKERSDPNFGRIVLKYVSDDYLMDKKAEEADTTDV